MCSYLIYIYRCKLLVCTICNLNISKYVLPLMMQILSTTMKIILWVFSQGCVHRVEREVLKLRYLEIDKWETISIPCYHFGFFTPYIVCAILFKSFFLDEKYYYHDNLRPLLWRLVGQQITYLSKKPFFLNRCIKL